MNFARTCLATLLLASLGGCMQLRDCVDQCMIDCRNRCYAQKAWWSCRSNFKEVDYRHDFGKGFRDGYVAVASGGSICQPALPPPEYWRYYNQNPCGQERQLAWFNGYSYGAVYAEEEGIGDWSRIVTSPTLPPYRKRRVGRTAAPATAGPAYSEGAVPDYSPPPVPAAAAPAIPSASAEDAEFLNPPADERQPASAAAVQWTDSFENY